MSHLQRSQNRINELLSYFVLQIKGYSAMSRTDLNKLSETILIPILSNVYGYRNLRNLNIEEANYPGIDLEGELFIADEVSKVAFQITATANTTKIKKTLQKFVEYELHKRYDRLIIYILVEKQKSYSGKGYDRIIKDKFEFDKSKDIIDYKDLLKEISNFQIDRCQSIEHILEANFGNNSNFKLNDNFESNTEFSYLNLLELFFPEQIYTAELNIDRNKVIEESWSDKYKISLRKESSTRDVIKAAIIQQHLPIGWDWHCYEGKLITFHDLTDDSSPLQKIIRKDTVRVFSSEDYYQQDENYTKTFKALLWRCIQEKLKYENVNWQHEEKIFIFSKIGDNPVRKESWFWNGRKNQPRTVYERRMKEKEPNKILHCKHFGFGIEYVFIGSKHYVRITPEWFFSFDEYRKSFYSKDNVSWIKRHENNRAVFNHVKFITYFLKAEQTQNLFSSSKPKSFLSFGDLVEFNNAMTLNDSEWKGNRDTSNSSNQHEQLTLPFDL